MNITIREVTEEDAEALSAIYRPYVEETGITFEYVPPDAEEFRRRIQHTKEKYPYLAACDEGKIIGYAYAGTFIGRSASDWNVELSIYMDRNDNGSRDFHEHLGFHETAHFRKCGFKAGRWVDLIWMEKTIGDKEGAPGKFYP